MVYLTLRPTELLYLPAKYHSVSCRKGPGRKGGRQRTELTFARSPLAAVPSDGPDQQQHHPRCQLGGLPPDGRERVLPDTVRGSPGSSRYSRRACQPPLLFLSAASLW